MGSYCPDGYVDGGGVCYLKCPSNYVNDDSGNCIELCPSGWKESNNTCLKPSGSTYYNGDGFTTEADCVNVAGECYKCSGKYFPKCYPGYSNDTCNTCTPLCQNGTVNSDNNCLKVVKPSGKSVPTQLSWSLILFILALVITAIIIFITAIKNRGVSSEKVFNIEYGTPGKNDAYARLTGQVANRKEIYV